MITFSSTNHLPAALLFTLGKMVCDFQCPVLEGAGSAKPVG